MQTTFTVRGKQVAPAYFTVFYFKGGRTVRMTGIVEDLDDMLYMQPDAIKCEVYKNGTHDTPPELIDQLQLPSL